MYNCAFEEPFETGTSGFCHHGGMDGWLMAGFKVAQSTPSPMTGPVVDATFNKC